MRRKEKEITDHTEMENILRRGEICRLAMAENDIPYVVAVNYGYADNALYIHSAPEGKKIDMLRRNNRVCFQVDTDVAVINTDSVHNCNTRYKSIIGYGTASIITDDTGKIAGLDVLMTQYQSDGQEYPQTLLDRMVIIKIDIESMTGKQSLE